MGTKFYANVIKNGATIIDMIQSSRCSPGLDVALLGGSGKIFKNWAGIRKSRPTIAFTTPQILTMLTLLASGGKTRGKLITSASALEVWMINGVLGGTRATTGLKINITDCLIVPGAISAPKDEWAMFSASAILAKSDGSAPFSATAGQTVPAAAAADGIYTMGPVTMDGVEIEDLEDWQLNYGAQVEAKSGSNSVYPRAFFVKNYIHSFSFTTLTEQLAALGITGTAVASDALFTAQLLSIAASGDRTGSGDKTFTINQGIIHVEEVGGDEGGEARSRVTVVPSFDGTNDPIEYA
jgi:hypothetical protein